MNDQQPQQPWTSELWAGPELAAPQNSDGRRWYQRRGPQVAVAGAAVAALVAGGVGVTMAASAIEPKQSLAAAVENLRDGPASVTFTSATEPGEITVIRTDQGVQVSVDSPTQDARFAAALVDERLYLRVDAAQLDQLTANPMAVGIIAGFPSVGALLDGQWVSIDVSEDSEVLAAIEELGAESQTDTDALQSAAEDLAASIEGIGAQLRGPLTDSVADNVTVTPVDGSAGGPDGSQHYEVSLDTQAVAEAIEPELRAAMDDLLAAVDTFVAEAGVPDGGDQWQTQRSEILAKFDEALANGPAGGFDEIDVWIADDEFTQIVAQDVTLTFNPEPRIDATAAAVSMDEDLLRLLPLAGTFGLPSGLPGLAG